MLPMNLIHITYCDGIETFAWAGELAWGIWDTLGRRMGHLGTLASLKYGTHSENEKGSLPNNDRGVTI